MKLFSDSALLSLNHVHATRQDDLLAAPFFCRIREPIIHKNSRDTTCACLCSDLSHLWFIHGRRLSRYGAVQLNDGKNVQ